MTKKVCQRDKGFMKKLKEFLRRGKKNETLTR